MKHNKLKIFLYKKKTFAIQANVLIETSSKRGLH